MGKAKKNDIIAVEHSHSITELNGKTKILSLIHISEPTRPY